MPKSIRSSRLRKRSIWRDSVDIELLLLGGMEIFSGLKPAQLVGIGQLIEAFQPEELKKERRCLVKKGAAGLVGATGNANDLALQQRGDDSVDGDAAHGLDLSTAQRLAVGDHRQRFERGLAQPWSARLGEKAIGPKGEIRSRLDLVTAGQTLDHQARTGIREASAQIFQRAFHLGQRRLLECNGFGRRSKARRLL